MKATMKLDSWKEPVSIEIPDDQIEKLIDSNGNAVAVNAMEELGELTQAIGKLVRSSKDKPTDLFAEESIDAMIFIGIMANYATKFSGLQQNQMEGYAVEKRDRFLERMADDEVIFRTKKAKKRNAAFFADAEASANAAPERPLEDILEEKGILGVGRSEDTDDEGAYELLGATDRSPEFLHVIFSFLTEKDPELARMLLFDMSRQVGGKFVYNEPEKDAPEWPEEPKPEIVTESFRSTPKSTPVAKRTPRTKNRGIIQAIFGGNSKK